MGALDELLAKWRENPDSGTTLALCTYLGTSHREDLIREVGSTAEAWHKDDGQVMLAVGRMYLDAGFMQEAQAALVAAGKLSPNASMPYRYLGEVLLRRGDASRAEKVLARSLQLGGAGADTKMWHDRAVVYVALQTRVGMRAVADEIERTIPKRNSIPPPTMKPEEAARLAGTTTSRQGVARHMPPPPKLVPSVPPPPVLQDRGHGAGKPVSGGARASAAEQRLPAFSENDIPTNIFDGHLLGRRVQSDGNLADALPSSSPPIVSSKPPPLPAAPAATRRPPTSTSSRAAAPAFAAAPSPRANPPLAAPALVPPIAAVAPTTSRPAPAPRNPPIVAPPPSRPSSPPMLALVPGVGPVRTIVESVDDSPNPSAETILEHLALVGVFERSGGAAPAWATPPRERPRGTWLFIAAIVLAAGGGFGGFRYAHQKRVERLAMAQELESQVKKALETGNVDDLTKTDDKLSRVFDLDSRSQEAAVLWLHNRVLSALMLPSEPRGIESALARCTTLEVDESRTVSGKITSFLTQGDLAGAAAILPKWDEKAKADPFYHLAAGAMLERAGDVRAVGHYKQAFDLDPDLVVARLFHAQLVTLELGIQTGKPLIEDVVARLGDTPSARALRGLEWALDPQSEATPPDGARVADADRTKLATPLLALPFVVDAQTAARAGKTDDALAALDKALKATATPAMASLIGQVAIDLGDERLARAATLRALSYSALYPRARSLAARVALLGGRLDDAKNAIQELDAKSPEVAVVRAAAAYEALDLSELESAGGAIGTDGPGRALAIGMNIVFGRKYPTPAVIAEIAVPSIPWGDLIGVDAALDTGNIALADKIVSRWGDRASTPTYALRKARLLRYQDKTEDAVKASDDALVAGGVTPRVLVERFQSLVANKNIVGARDLIGQYPAVLGPMTDFLKVSLDVADDKAARAKVLAARVEPPPDGSPLLFQLIAAEAFNAVGDARGKPLLGVLVHLVPKDPELVLEIRK